MKYLSVKKSGVLFSISLLAAFLVFMTGCVKQNFDEPPINVPHYTAHTANATIDTLAKLYGNHPDTLLITQDIIIKGIVAGNDESGNIYKKIFVQDSTAGIDIEIDGQYLYTQFKIGQRVYIECKGLYLGTYGGTIATGGALELGYPYNGAIGRMPGAVAFIHIFPDSLPGKAPVPMVVDLLSGSYNKYLSKLVAIPDVRFPNAGQPGFETFVIGGATTSQPVGDITGSAITTLDGKSLILYTSSYADFANNLLPLGIGTIQGIFTVYGSKYELLVRNIKDVVNFIDTGQTIIYQNSFYTSPTDWVIFTPASNKPWTWSSTYLSMLANGFGGNAPCDTWLISPGLDLTNITNPILSFSTWTNYTDSGFPNPLEVKISTDYSGSGNPSAATWAALQCTLSPAGSKVLDFKRGYQPCSYPSKSICRIPLQIIRDR